MYLITFSFIPNYSSTRVFKSRVICAEAMTSEVVEKFMKQASDAFESDVCIHNIIKLDDKPSKNRKQK